jgi:hypothetical protein
MRTVNTVMVFWYSSLSVVPTAFVPPQDLLGLGWMPLAEAAEAMEPLGACSSGSTSTWPASSASRLPGMTDEEILFEGSLQDWLNKSLVVLASRWPHTEAPPAEFTEWIRDLQPSAATVNAAMDRLIDQFGGLDYVIRRNQQTVAVIGAKPFPLPVPTVEELTEADKALRAEVLPGTSEQEVEEAVAAIPADPEKVKTAALLAELVRRTTGLPAPWAAFVFSFCVALAMNPDVVAALGLAFAVLAYMQSPKPGS